MSKFNDFMKTNKKIKKNEFYAPTESLCDKEGSPLKWEFRHLSSEEGTRIKNDCSREVQVTGKPNMYRTKMDLDKYNARLITASVVFPDLNDVELQDSYGVKTPEELIHAMVDDMGEYQALVLWVQQLQGLDRSFEEKVDEVKN